MTAPMFACSSQFVKLCEAAPTREPHHKINLAQFDQLYQVSINKICSNFSKMLFAVQYLIFSKEEYFSKRASKRWTEMSVLDGTKMDVKSGHKQKWFVCRKAPVSCIWSIYCISRKLTWVFPVFFAPESRDPRFFCFPRSIPVVYV